MPSPLLRKLLRERSAIFCAGGEFCVFRFRAIRPQIHGGPNLAEAFRRKFLPAPRRKRGFWRTAMVGSRSAYGDGFPSAIFTRRVFRGQFRLSAHFPQPPLRSGPFFGDGRKRHEPLSRHFPFAIARHGCTAFRFSKKYLSHLEINLRFESGLKRGLAAFTRTLHGRPALFFGRKPGATNRLILSSIRAPAHSRRKLAQCGLKKRRTSTKRAF